MCKDHKRYKGIKKPRNQCIDCWYQYLANSFCSDTEIGEDELKESMLVIIENIWSVQHATRAANHRAWQASDIACRGQK